MKSPLLMLSAAAFLLLSPVGLLAQVDPACHEGTSRITGTISGLGHDPFLLLRSSRSCIALVDSAGRFTLPTVAGSQVVTGLGPAFCVEAAVVDVPQGGTATVSLRAVPTKSPLDDTMLLLPGAGYLPRTYQDRQCRASEKYVREHSGIQSLAGAPSITPPDSVIAIVLRSDSLSASLGSDLPLRFSYWHEPTASAVGNVDGRRYVIEQGLGRFIVVEESTPDSLLLLIGNGGGSVLWHVDLRSRRVARRN